MKYLKATLIILLTTATLAAATERGVLWFSYSNEVYEIDVETGSIYYNFTKPTGTNHGLGYDGTYFYAGYNWSPPTETEIYKFDKNGLLISSFIIPAGDGCWAVTYENGTLWTIIWFNGRFEKYVYHIDLNGSILPPDPFLVHYLSNDLTYDGEYIWIIAGEGTDCDVLCYDPNTGALLDSFPVGDPYYYGTETRTIATDDTYIYTIGWERFLDSQSWIYKFTKSGTQLDHIYTELLGLGIGHRGLSYYEEGVTAIEPLSFGKLKAIYR
jgi:hypothetical protein